MESNKSNMIIRHGIDVTLITFNDIEIIEEGHIQAHEESIMSVLEEGKCQNMLLDFSNVQFMSSAFLSLLVKIHKRICERGGKLELCNIKPEIYKVFEITQLNKVFTIN
jgi:anti-sigma B factor antagonist